MEPKITCKDNDCCLNNLHLHLAPLFLCLLLYYLRGEEGSILSLPSSWDGLPGEEQLREYISQKN